MLKRLKLAKETGRVEEVLSGGFYDPRAWRKHYEEFYEGKVTSTTVPPYSAPNVHLAGSRHPVTGIVFDQRGFPIFDDVAKYDTRLPSVEFKAASYQSQMRMATRDLRDQIDANPQLRAQFNADQIDAIKSGSSKIPGYTWHHHQDSARMQLVPSDLHSRTGHIGSESMSQGK
ncbi:HNH endonuclease [Pannonibacter phragmitetus]|uniref:HNH endonuclease n=1 Tax=Pannonibacter phragmitetus TaxID=121719 RepID=UPI003D2F05C6